MRRQLWRNGLLAFFLFPLWLKKSQASHTRSTVAGKNDIGFDFLCLPSLILAVKPKSPCFPQGLGPFLHDPLLPDRRLALHLEALNKKVRTKAGPSALGN